MPSSGMWRRVDLVCTDVSEDIPEDGILQMNSSFVIITAKAVDVLLFLNMIEPHLINLYITSNQ
jgi:hypothetical protein